MPALEVAAPHPPATVPRALVFDGYCHVCSGWARFLARHPTDPPFSLIPMQSAPGKQLLARNRYRWFGRRTTCCLAP
jgi:predicted DCC family thiol-disulfide oxidoreductase YuxK